MRRWPSTTPGSGTRAWRWSGPSDPRFVELDRNQVAGIDGDPARQAQVRTLVSVADGVGTTVVATGIETEEELVTFRDLGVGCGQGYLLGRPSELVHA